MGVPAEEIEQGRFTLPLSHHQKTSFRQNTCITEISYLQYATSLPPKKQLRQFQLDRLGKGIMKVVHVTTIDIGGAYKAAVRLHEGLMRIGVQSEILLRTNHA